MENKNNVGSATAVIFNMARLRDMIEYKIFIGNGTAPLIDTVSALRVRHFRGYPYLYDGEHDRDYEKRYIEELARNERGMVAVAYSDDTPIGIATSLPLASEADILDGVSKKFIQSGYHPADFYYVSEIIVLPEYRHNGIATRLYEYMEAQAIQWRYTCACLSTVLRDDDDPRKPRDFQKDCWLWQRLGFTCTDIKFDYGWPTFLKDESSRHVNHEMVMWIKNGLK